MPGLFTPVGMPQQNMDMSTMYTNGAPLQYQQSNMPMSSASPIQGDMSVVQPEQLPMQNDMPVADMPEAPLGIPTYVGNPVLDKYIHMFLGAV